MTDRCAHADLDGAHADLDGAHADLDGAHALAAAVAQIPDGGSGDGDGSAVANLRREFDEVIEQSADVLTRHENGRYTYVSPASRRVYGLEPEQMLGRSPFEFIHPDDAERVAAAVAAGLAQGGGFQVEHRIRRPDGSCIWVEAAVRWNTDSDIGFGAVRDISSQRAREAELRESNVRFEAAFEHAPIGMALTDLDGRWIKINRALSEITGYTTEELHNRSFRDITHPDDVEADIAGFAALKAGERESYEVEKRYLHADGSVIWVALSTTVLHDEDGKPQSIVAKMQDISLRKAQESELREVTQRFEGAFDHAPIGMSLVGIDGRWIRVNRALCQITGYGEPELLSKSFQEITHPADLTLGSHGLAAMLRGERETWDCEKRYFHADGRIVWVALSTSVVRDEAGEPQYIVAQTRDVTEQKQLKERLQHIADHDPLTGLFSRLRFEAELERQVRLSRRYGDCAALLLLDLDHFKYVNDSLGHTVGDRVIAHVGALLSDRLRDTDIVARLGGDEFAVILPHVDEAQARVIADDVVGVVGQSDFMHDGHRYLLSASVGIAMLNRETASAEDALVTVDIALYDAKQRGRNRAAVYAPSTREDVLNGLTWSQRLRAALANNGLQLHAQPIVDLHTGETVMHELLVRMRSETGRLIPPSRFLAPAARFGYMPAVDRWVIAQALQLASSAPDRCLTINLAAKTIAEPGLVDFIMEQVAQTGADPTKLMFELSEADVIANLDQASETCERLRTLGCGIALDDFGSGFSGFSYLRALQIDLLKIDGQFIRELATNELDRLVVRAILDVARGMAIPTVVEFVTGEAVAEQCRLLGATYGQGFHLGRPAPVSEIGACARTERARPPALREARHQCASPRPSRSSGVSNPTALVTSSALLDAVAPSGSTSVSSRPMRTSCPAAAAAASTSQVSLP